MTKFGRVWLSCVLAAFVIGFLSHAVLTILCKATSSNKTGGISALNELQRRGASIRFHQDVVRQGRLSVANVGGIVFTETTLIARDATLMGQLPELMWLEARDCHLSKEFLFNAVSSLNLEKVVLVNCTSDEPGFGYLANIQGLARMRARQMVVSHCDLQLLAQRSLWLFDLTNSTVGKEELKALEDSTIMILNLSGTPVDDQCANALSRMKSLCTLILDDTAVTDETLDTLTASDTLKKLYARRTQVTNEGASVFSKEPSGVKIVVE